MRDSLSMSVQSIRPQLTDQDIHRLMKGETPEQRASVAHRLCRRMALDVLSDHERKYAEEIMGILAADAAELVRRTLAVTLRNSPVLPREIALKLAQDVEAVAIPLLQESPVFTDEDLIELVLAVTSAKQAAIAGRESLSVTVTEVISEHGALEAVRTLTANSGAEFSDHAYEEALRRFGKDEAVQGGLIRRDYIPTHIAEKMVSLVSGQMFDMLVNRHELPAQMAIDLAAGARERATVDLVEQAGRSHDLPFAHHVTVRGGARRRARFVVAWERTRRGDRSADARGRSAPVRSPPSRAPRRRAAEAETPPDPPSRRAGRSRRARGSS